jgi:hypothetical protein
VRKTAKPPSKKEPFLMEAWRYETMPDKRVRCLLCSHQGVIGNHKRGICGVREKRYRPSGVSDYGQTGGSGALPRLRNGN